MKKSLFLLILAVFLPLCGWAEEQGYAVFDSATGTLTFKYGNMPTGDNVFEVSSGWETGWSELGYKKVIFDSSFAKARLYSTSSWFYDAEALEEIVGLEYLNTREVTDMTSMFSGCSSLTSLDLSHFDTSNVTDMRSMFSECSSLTSLDVSNFNTSNVTDMSRMFSVCSLLTSLDLSSFNTSQVTNMSDMFSRCLSLTSLDVTNFDTSNVTYMSNMFKECSSLPSLDLSHFDTSNVTRMSRMFSGCSSLTSLDLSHFDTSNVTDMWGMFSGCSSLPSLDLSHFDTSNVSSMSSMFSECSSLTSLDLSHFDTSNVTDMGFMFYGCSSLTSLDLSNFDTSNVTYMRNMFSECSSLPSLDLSHFDTANVTDIGLMFLGCSSLSSLDLSHFDTSNVTHMEGVFSGCSSLPSLDLSHFNTTNVTNMLEMFRFCRALKTIYIGEKWDVSNVTESASMFNECTSLVGQDGTIYNSEKIDHTYAHAGTGGYMTYKQGVDPQAEPLKVKDEFKVDGIHYQVINTDPLEVQVGNGNYASAIDKSVSGAVTIPAYVTGPDGNKYTVISIGRCAFRGCENLSQVYLPNSLLSLKTECFADCFALTSIVIPKSVTNIEENSFQSCDGITSMVVEEGNTVYDSRDNCNAIIKTENNELIAGCHKTVIPSTVAIIGERSFFGIQSLSSIEIPSSVTTIRSHAFYECTGLTSISIPSSVVSIEGYNPFAWCSNVKSIVVDEANPKFDSRGNCNAIINSETNKLVSGCMNTVIPEDVEHIGDYAFSHSPIAEVTLPKGLKTIGQAAFGSCKNLTSIELPNTVTALGKWTFENCKGLSNIVIPNSLTTMGDLVFQAIPFTSVTSKITKPFAISSNVFMKYDIPLYVPYGTKSLYQATDGWKNFTNIIEMEPEVTPAEKQPYAVLSDDKTILTFYYDEKKAEREGMDIGPFNWESRENRGWHTDASMIENVVFDSSFADYTELTSTAYWFYDCSKLIAVKGMEDLKTDNVTDMAGMFKGCSSLTSLDMSRFNTSNVTNMLDMFQGCSSLTSLDVRSFNTAKVGSMAFMFSGCSSLTSLDVSNFNTSSVTYMQYMFGACSSLTSLDLSNFNTSSVTEMKFMFQYCSALTSLDVSNFNTSSVAEMSAMFVGCSSLTSLDLSSFNTSGVTAMNGMFSECSSLTSLDLSHFDTSSVTYMGGMFQACNALKTIYIGDKWTVSHVTSGEDMFTECTSLVGQDGTTYDSAKTDHTYAHANAGGYMTMKNAGQNELEPAEKKQKVDFSDFTETTPLNGTVIDNVFYSIKKDNGGYDTSKKCVVVNSAMSDTEMEAIAGETLDNISNKYTGMVLQVPAGKGRLSVNAQATGGLVLKVKIGTNAPKAYSLKGKMKIRVEYDVQVPTYIYIYAGETPASARARRSGVEPSLMIYGISTGLVLGDANGDDSVDVSDVVSTVNKILAKPSNNFDEDAADVNGDGSIDVADVVATVNIILGRTNAAREKNDATGENDRLSLTDSGNNAFSLSLDNEGRYVAAQFEVRLSEGQTLESVLPSLSRLGDHQVAVAEVGSGRYRVVVYDLGLSAFSGHNGELLTLQLADANSGLTIDNITFVRGDQTVRHFAPLFAGPTAITSVVSPNAPADIYSIDGHLLRRQATSTEGLKRGLYIVNGRKMYLGR